MFKLSAKGDYKRTINFLKTNPDGIADKIMKKYGALGVQALSEATPVDTGETASSWYYKIKRKNGRVELQFCNKAQEDGCKIAVILQYGHATNSGGWVEGRDYINPVLRPVFDNIVADAWREVKGL